MQSASSCAKKIEAISLCIILLMSISLLKLLTKAFGKWRLSAILVVAIGQGLVCVRQWLQLYIFNPLTRKLAFLPKLPAQLFALLDIIYFTKTKHCLSTSDEIFLLVPIFDITVIFTISINLCFFHIVSNNNRCYNYRIF